MMPRFPNLKLLEKKQQKNFTHRHEAVVGEGLEAGLRADGLGQQRQARPRPRPHTQRPVAGRGEEHQVQGHTRPCRVIRLNTILYFTFNCL